jgi:hypothetical protein
MLPGDEVARAGDLEVDHPALPLRLGGVGVIEAVGRLEHGGIGEVGVEDGVGEGGGGAARPPAQEASAKARSGSRMRIRTA